MSTVTIPDPGQLVEVRTRPFVVQRVEAAEPPPDPLHRGDPRLPQHLVTLSSVEDDALGEELRVIWELELGTRAYERMALPDPAGFDPPRRLDAFLDAVRWGAVASADLRALQAPFRSGIAIEDYQLDPVVRAIAMPRANLLIADDVGLGKTIEAGLVAQELLLRHRARTILVVCPSALQVQWHDQMRDKFGLTFRVVNAELMRELRRTRGLHVNPWTHFPRLITSIDYLKREGPLRLFREVLPPPGTPAFPRRFNLLIVDEAHNVAPSGQGRDAAESERTHAIRTLAPHFEHRLFLTATPHNGYQDSFTALLEMLDDQRFARGIPPDRVQLAAIMVRRLKTEMPERFPARRLDAIEVPYTGAERRAHQALQEYTELRQRDPGSQAERFAAEFVLKLLKKRLFSSPAAFAGTLRKHEESLHGATRRAARAAATIPTQGLLHRLVAGLDEDFADDEEYAEAEREALHAATLLFRSTTPPEAALLDELRAWAIAAADRGDSKVATLLGWLAAMLKPDGGWSQERVIIFTEYRDTQRWLQERLVAAGFGGEGRLLLLHGGLDTEDRERVKHAFQSGPADAAVRILLATDAASEGIDLQNHCARLIHYEIPWNPNRMEQRNGRIDRHGQSADEVLIFHFVGAGYARPRPQDAFVQPGSLEGDLEFLFRAARKVETIREDLGKVGPVIASQVEEAMLGRRARLDTALAEREGSAVRAQIVQGERRLREQIARLHERLLESREALHISPEHIQLVVETGLELAGQPPLRPTQLPGVWPDPTGQRHSCPVFTLPDLRGSWARCTEGLEHPHTRAIRPVVFDHALASGRDDVVLVHLNHRLVAMCQGLLRAEIWSVEGRKSLHRVTARLVPDGALAVPVVVAHGRLVVLGGDNQRLHEEIIVAGGRLQDRRFARLGVGEVQAALDAALPDPAPDAWLPALRTLWPDHREPLLRALEARAKERETGLLGALEDRRRQELHDSRTILGELRAAILREVAVLGGDPAATYQPRLIPTEGDELLRRNVDALLRRADAIPAEIAQEASAIVGRYAAPNPSLFPVAVTYLIPEGLASREIRP